MGRIPVLKVWAVIGHPSCLHACKSVFDFPFIDCTNNNSLLTLSQRFHIVLLEIDVHTYTVWLRLSLDTYSVYLSFCNLGFPNPQSVRCQCQRYKRDNLPLRDLRTSTKLLSIPATFTTISSTSSYSSS